MPTILAVDDKEENRYLVSRLLRRAGFEVREAATGEEGLRLAAESPDLIILDISLPDMSGSEVCRRIRADPRTAAIPVLHLSALFTQEGDQAAGPEGGADAYLTLPIDPPELIASVKALLRAHRAEENWQKTVREWQTTFDAIRDGILLLDEHAQVVRCNRALADLLGKPFPDIIGHGFAELLPALHDALRDALPGPEELRPRRPEVRELPWGERWLRVTVDPTPATEEGPAGAVCVVADVTEIKRAERQHRESEELFRQFAENVRAVLWIFDPVSQRLLYVSPAYEALWGRPCQEVYDDPRAGLAAVHPEDRPRVEQAFRDKAVRGTFDEEYRVVRPDGSLRWVRNRAFPIRDAGGAVYRLCGIAEDVTERRLAEEALREAARRKDEFFVMLAHELRNPLGPVRNAVEVLRLSGPSEPVLQQARDMIARQVDHMARLVEDLLDVSRIARGNVPLRLERLDLGALVRATAEDYRSTLDRGGVRLELDLPAEPVWVQGDPTRLAQVVGNVLHNAAKFTDAGGRVLVRVRPEPGGTTAAVAVRDTGIGMEPQMLARVFEAFAQADRTLTRSRGGLGLGLTLVKGLVELHGGLVEAASDGPGKGAEFVIRLPREAGPGPSSSAGTPARRAAQTQRILVVEDCADAAHSMQILLEALGHEVAVALSGAAGLAQARTFRPQVVLCDIGLPGGMDGYGLARALRREEGLAPLYLIALTGYGADEDVRRARQAGFDLHMTKPVDLDELRQALAAAPGGGQGPGQT
jgi:PAS domain S-box-containing protein